MEDVTNPPDLTDTDTAVPPVDPIVVDKPKPAKKVTGAKAVAAPTGKRLFRCSVPQDQTLPPQIVEAMTAGDAERVYRDELGIVTTGHPISVVDYGNGN